MRWCVVIRALNTTTQLLFAVLSKSVSASCGIFTFMSFVHCIRSKLKKKYKSKHYNELYAQRRSSCYFVYLHWEFILEALTSVLCSRNYWAVTHSLLKFTAFYQKMPSMNFKSISVILRSSNMSSINNLLQQKLCPNNCPKASGDHLNAQCLKPLNLTKNKWRSEKQRKAETSVPQETNKQQAPCKCSPSTDTWQQMRCYKPLTSCCSVWIRSKNLHLHTSPLS